MKLFPRYDPEGFDQHLKLESADAVFKASKNWGRAGRCCVTTVQNSDWCFQKVQDCVLKWETDREQNDMNLY